LKKGRGADFFIGKGREDEAVLDVASDHVRVRKSAALAGGTARERKGDLQVQWEEAPSC